MASMITTTPRLNLVQRALNRAGRQFGVMPFPIRFQPEGPLGGPRDQVFKTINEHNLWGSSESVSGPGSELNRTKKYRDALLEMLRRRNITSMFDAPCGDLNWIRLVLDQYSLQYEGGDISEGALTVARRVRPGVNVYRFDICTDLFPDLQLWHCRDALFHLSFADIWLALKNVSNAQFEYALITTNRARWLKNVDIKTGAMRYLDFERAPFSLGRPLEYLPDGVAGEFPRYVALWPIDAIRNAVKQANV